MRRMHACGLVLPGGANRAGTRNPSLRAEGRRFTRFPAATQSEFAARLAGHRRFTMSMSHRSLQAAIIEVNDTTILIIAITGGIFGVACLGISVWAYCRCKKAMKSKKITPIKASQNSLKEAKRG